MVICDFQWPLFRVLQVLKENWFMLHSVNCLNWFLLDKNVREVMTEHTVG